MSYNGWSNWETWNMKLWLDNEEPLYRDMIRFVRAHGASAVKIEQHVRDLMPNGTPDMDETDGGYNAVNWDEIAKAYEDKTREDEI